MSRVVVLVALVWCLAPALAGASTGKEAPGREPKKGTESRKAEPKPEKPQEEAEEYVLTEKSEIKFNGRPCKFEQVPDKATIVLLEVAEDGKTILRIHFEKKK
jgi:hypothetical protein